jgi:hypothetical protein
MTSLVEDLITGRCRKICGNAEKYYQLAGHIAGYNAKWPAILLGTNVAKWPAILLGAHIAKWPAILPFCQVVGLIFGSLLTKWPH